MNTITINSPAMPYWGIIPGNVFPGKVINIKGTFPVSMDKNLFSKINLCEATEDIIAFHLSIRFNHREVVRNSHINGHWAAEEKGGPFPFEFGSEFWIRIVVQEDAYHISVNGQHCWTFRHRMPFLNVNSVSIDGPFQIYQVEFVNQNEVFPSGGCRPPGPYPWPVSQPGVCVPPFPRPGSMNPPYQPGTSQPVMPFLEPVFNPPVPFTQMISGGIQPGMMFYISGIPAPNFRRFTVNFQCGAASYPEPDVAFHFDVRAFSGTIVRNTRRDNQWGQEELDVPNFPFAPSAPFDMMVLVQNDKYMVAINGKHFIEYAHRLTRFSFINTLRIENDITLTSVRFAH